MMYRQEGHIYHLTLDEDEGLGLLRRRLRPLLLGTTLWRLHRRRRLLRLGLLLRRRRLGDLRLLCHLVVALPSSASATRPGKSEIEQVQQQWAEERGRCRQLLNLTGLIVPGWWRGNIGGTHTTPRQKRTKGAGSTSNRAKWIERVVSYKNSRITLFASLTQTACTRTFQRLTCCQT
jgi:hypothetical protein